MSTTNKFTDHEYAADLEHCYYCLDQQATLIYAINHTPEVGSFEGQDFKAYDVGQTYYILCGRSDSGMQGNIDDLDPEKYSRGQMSEISRGRGDNKKFANIDDLDPQQYDWIDMMKISMQRAKDGCQPEVDKPSDKRMSRSDSEQPVNDRQVSKVHCYLPVHTCTVDLEDPDFSWLNDLDDDTPF